jgi:hypothetical protein
VTDDRGDYSAHDAHATTPTTPRPARCAGCDGRFLRGDLLEVHPEHVATVTTTLAKVRSTAAHALAVTAS